MIPLYLPLVKLSFEKSCAKSQMFYTFFLSLFLFSLDAVILHPAKKRGEAA